LSDKKRIGFIGYGKMGDAIGSAVHQSNLDITIMATEENPERQIWIKQHREKLRLTSIDEVIKQSDLVFLAIKPQKLSDLSNKLSLPFKQNQLVVSMLAGVSIDTCCKKLNHNHVVRIMPNTPAILAKGVTGACFLNHISDNQKAFCVEILSTFGNVIELQDESHLDIMTAISGSGPAFFYRMVNAFVDFSVKKGLPKSLAEKAVVSTMIGAGYMLSEFGDPKKQIEQVSSPNGTTLAGLKKMDDHHFDDIIKNVLNSTLDRAKELSKEC